MTEHNALLATLIAAGWTDERIAEVVPLSAQAITIVRASPLFQALLVRTRADLHRRTASSSEDRLRALVPKAVQVYEDAMDQRDDLSAALRAADRVTEHEARRAPEVHLHLDAAERKLLEAVAIEITSTEGSSTPPNGHCCAPGPGEWHAPECRHAEEAGQPTNGHGMTSLDDAIAAAERDT